MSEKTPLFGAPYNSRFNTDIDLLVYEDTFQYSNMVFHGFYGGTSLQSQELNELQETIHNQISKSNEFFGNWMQHGATTSDPLEITTRLEQTTLPVDPTLSQDTTIIDKGWYRYTNNNLHQFIQVPGITYKDSTLPLVKLNTLLSKRNVFGRLEDWEDILTDNSEGDALDIYGAHRQQVYVNIPSSIEMEPYNSYLPLFRVPNMDIYGLVIEKSHYDTAIDTAYPKSPYVVEGENMWRSVGDIKQFQEIILKQYPRSAGESSLAFSAGALGLLIDNSYISGLDGPTLPELIIRMNDNSDLDITQPAPSVGQIIFQSGMNSAANSLTGVAKSCVGFVREIDSQNKYITIGFNDISKAYNFVKNVKLTPESGKTPILVGENGGSIAFNTGATFIDTTNININQRWYMNNLLAAQGRAVSHHSSWITSIYDVGDNARKSGPEFQTIVPSTINKYQWFDFETNEVMGSNRYSVAAGFFGVTIISKVKDDIGGGPLFNKINTPRGGYVSVGAPTHALWELLISKPSVDVLRSINPELIDNDGENGPRAKIRELWSTRVHENTDIISEDIKFVSIDTAVNQATITLDDKGTVRILWCFDLGATVLGLGDYIYYDKEWIEKDGFLTDENGPVSGLNNIDFVQVCVSGGFGVHPCMAWLLHKNGKLYGVELNSSRKHISNKEVKKKPTDADFGTPNPQDNLSSMLHIYNPFNITTPDGSGTLNGLFPTTIKHWLNSVPKVDEKRLPIIFVGGGYGPWPGHAICAFPPSNGDVVIPKAVFNHPVQTVQLIIFGAACDGLSVSEMNNRITTRDIVALPIVLYRRGAFKKLQIISSIFDKDNDTWSYISNENFDSELYDLLMGVKVTVDNTDHIVHVPPRSFFCNNNVYNGIGVLSNNGIYATIGCYNTSPLIIGSGTDFSGCGATLPSILAPQDQFDSGMIKLQGDFSLPSSIFSRHSIYAPFMCQKHVTHKKVLPKTNSGVDSDDLYILNHIGFNVNASHILCDIDNLVYSSRNTNAADTGMENLYGESSVPYIDPAKIIKKVITGAANSGIIFDDDTCVLWGKNTNRQLLFGDVSFNTNIRDIIFIGSGISDNNSNNDNFTLIIYNDNTTTVLSTESFDSNVYGSNVPTFNGVERWSLAFLTNTKQITYIKTESHAAQILVTTHDSSTDTWRVIPYGPVRTTTQESTYPISLITGISQKIIQAEQSEEEGYVLTDDGKIMLWPTAVIGSPDKNRQDLITDLINVKKIAVTRDGLLVLKGDGSVNYFGKLTTNTGRHLSQSCESINADNIFINDIYTGYWHGAIFIYDNNKLIFSYNDSFPIDVNDTLPLPFVIGKWDPNSNDIQIIPNNVLMTYKTHSSNGNNLIQNYNDNYVFTEDGTHFEYQPVDHFQSTIGTAFSQQGFGLPPGKMETITELEDRGIYYPDKYNYTNFFGNTFESEFYPDSETRLRAPLSQQFLKNYINNSHIVSIIAYKDHNDKLPFKVVNNQAVWDDSYLNSMGYDISLLSIGNSQYMDNPLAWVIGYGNGISGVRQDGSIMVLGKRTLDADHYIGDPFLTGVFPDRPLQLNGNWKNIRPQSYNNKLKDLKEIGNFSI